MSITSETSNRTIADLRTFADRESAICHANACLSLSRAFALPAQMSTSDPDLLCEAFDEYADPMRNLADRVSSVWRSALASIEELSIAYSRLFLGPFKIFAPPYATMYLDPDRRLMGSISQQALQYYTDSGLTFSAGTREVPDHVAIELEFMYYLAFQQSTSGEQLWTIRQRNFWLQHLGLWLPDLSGAISKAKCHDFYTALARLLDEFCMAQASLWGAEDS